MNLKFLAVIAAFVLAPVSANAALLVVQGGGPYDVTQNSSQFFGEVTAAGGAGSYTIDFFSSQDPIPATASATVGVIVSGTFSGLTLSWVDSNTNAVLASTPIVPILTSLDTLFTGAFLAQKLVISWTGSQAGAGFDFEVQSIPVPGALLLFGTALAGLGFGGMRRKTA